jgi:hypothetical protein
MFFIKILVDVGVGASIYMDWGLIHMVTLDKSAPKAVKSVNYQEDLSWINPSNFVV